jgi:hypothetical protein
MSRIEAHGLDTVRLEERHNATETLLPLASGKACPIDAPAVLALPVERLGDLASRLAAFEAVISPLWQSC